MVNIDKLPKSIKYNGETYFLDMHVTAFNKLCICYQYAFSPREAHEKKIEYNILSQVVEPDMKLDDIPVIEISSKVTDIFDVPDYDLAFTYLDVRLKKALRENAVELYK